MSRIYYIAPQPQSEVPLVIMNAYQPSQHPIEQQPVQQPVPKRRQTPRPKRHLRQRSYQIMALETTAKMGVNCAITAVAISALAQLLPYHWLQQQKLREIRTEVNLIEARVNQLQAEFDRSFDPRQTRSIMQQQTARRDPNLRPLVITPEASDSGDSKESP